MKVKIILFVLIVWNISADLFAQTDSIYLNRNGMRCSKDSASLLRVAMRLEEGFSIKEYLISGELKSTGSALSLDPLIKNGKFVFYRKNGSILSEGYYSNDKQDSLWSEYNEDGNVSSKYLINKDSITVLEGKNPNDKVYTYVEEMPAFNGGMEAYKKYLTENVHYPERARRKKIEGTVYVGFTVGKDGSVTNVRVRRGFNDDCDKEGVRVVSEMPNWLPGRQNGKPVNVEMVSPIKFSLSKK